MDDDPTATLDGGDTEAQLELRDFPATYDAEGLFMRGMVGVFAAFFAATKTTGEVTLEEHAPAKGYARYALRWR